MGCLSMYYNITPTPKPRMTIRDKWLNPPRPHVQRYWDFKDEVRKANIELPECNFRVTFYLPMPKSWSKKKKDTMNLEPHQQKPDKDNLEKALLDAIFDDDSHIWDSRVTKRWSYEGGICIERIIE